MSHLLSNQNLYACHIFLNWQRSEKSVFKIDWTLIPVNILYTEFETIEQKPM